MASASLEAGRCPSSSRVAPWAQERFDGIQVVRDLGTLLRGRAVEVVRPCAHALDEHVKWGSEEHDVLEAVVEAALVLHRARDDHIAVGGQKSVHALFVPHAVGQFPAVIVGVHRRVSSAPKLLQDGRLACA
jgi:hypothetical protein